LTRPPSFDFGAATLQGFNLPGGKSYFFRVAIWAALLITIVYVVLGAPVVRAFVDLGQNAIEADYNLDGSVAEQQDVISMMVPMFRAMGILVLIGFFQVAIFAVAETAIYRNLFHGEDRGVFPLTFGIDELRVFGTRIVVGFILSGIYMAAYVLPFLLGGVLVGIGDASGLDFLAGIGAVSIFLLIIAGFTTFVWVAVRLAPTAAYSVKMRTFSPLASWAPMKGFVWPAIGGYLLLYLVGYTILSFVLAIVFLLLFMASGIFGVLMEIDTASNTVPDVSPVWEHMSSAGFIIPLVIAIFTSVLLMMIWYGMTWSLWGYFAKDEEAAEFWKPDMKSEP